jgi:hypothetical protein
MNRGVMCGRLVVKLLNLLGSRALPSAPFVKENVLTIAVPIQIRVCADVIVENHTLFVPCIEIMR